MNSFVSEIDLVRLLKSPEWIEARWAFVGLDAIALDQTRDLDLIPRIGQVIKTSGVKRIFTERELWDQNQAVKLVALENSELSILVVERERLLSTWAQRLVESLLWHGRLGSYILTSLDGSQPQLDAKYLQGMEFVDFRGEAALADARLADAIRRVLSPITSASDAADEGKARPGEASQPQEWIVSEQRVIASDLSEAKIVLEEISANLAAHDWEEKDLFGIRLAVEETLVNAIKHGNQNDPQKSVVVDYKLSVSRFQIAIEDEGAGFDMSVVPDPTEEQNLETGVGRGLMLMRSFMDVVFFNERGNRVQLEKVRNQDDLVERKTSVAEPVRSDTADVGEDGESPLTRLISEKFEKADLGTIVNELATSVGCTVVPFTVAADKFQFEFDRIPFRSVLDIILSPFGYVWQLTGEELIVSVRRSPSRGVIAAISDIHGNLDALDAVLADIRSQGIDNIYCLGDITGLGANPVECMNIALSFQMRILGDHDQAALFDPEGFHPIAERAVFWTRNLLERSNGNAKLSEQRWETLGEMPRTHKEGDFLFVHGSPRNPLNEPVFPEDIYNRQKMDAIFSRIERYCVAGHTRIPGIFTEDGEFLSPEEIEHRFELGDKKALINVGSVGMSADGDARACYAILDGKIVRFRRVSYDVQRATSRILAIPELDNQIAEIMRTATSLDDPYTKGTKSGMPA